MMSPVAIFTIFPTMVFSSLFSLPINRLFSNSRELSPAPGGYLSFGAGSITFSQSSACLYGLLEARNIFE